MIHDVSFHEFADHGGITVYRITMGAPSADGWSIHVPKGKLLVAGGFALPVVDGRTCSGSFWDGKAEVAQALLENERPYRGKLSNALVLLLGHTNYYHFMIGRAPMLIFARMFPANAPLTWATRTRMPPVMEELFPDVLAKVLEGRALQRVELEDGEYDLENAIVPLVGGARTAAYFHRKFTLPPILRRSGLIDGLDGLTDLKLFVRRVADRRRLLNQEEIERWHVERGYLAIDPGTMTLQEQALTFARATEIVGVEGAALTNLAFAVRARRIICLANPVAARDRFFSDIVLPLNTPYRTVTGKFVMEAGKLDQITRWTDFWVSPADIEAAHDEMSAEHAA